MIQLVQLFYFRGGGGGLSDNSAPVKAACRSLTPSQDRKKDLFHFFYYYYSFELVLVKTSSASLAIVPKSHTQKLFAHVKDPISKCQLLPVVFKHTHTHTHTYTHTHRQSDTIMKTQRKLGRDLNKS